MLRIESIRHTRTISEDQLTGKPPETKNINNDAIEKEAPTKQNTTTFDTTNNTLSNSEKETATEEKKR